MARPRSRSNEPSSCYRCRGSSASTPKPARRSSPTSAASARTSSAAASIDRSPATRRCSTCRSTRRSSCSGRKSPLAARPRTGCSVSSARIRTRERRCGCSRGATARTSATARRMPPCRRTSPARRWHSTPRSISSALARAPKRAGVDARVPHGAMAVRSAPRGARPLRANVPRERAAVVTEPAATIALEPGARQALGSFLDGLRGRNASPGTVVEYERHATEFLAFLAQRRADWRTPDRGTVRAYLSTLAERGLAPTSVGGRLAAVRSLYRHALRHGRIEVDPLAGVRAPRRPSRLPRVLSVDEASALVTAPRRMTSRDEALARRDGAMLELLYASGMRISELAGLTIDRVDVGRRRLRVTGKGNKERQLLFGGPAASALRAYLDHARPILAARGAGDDGTVFLNAHGRSEEHTSELQ